MKKESDVEDIVKDMLNGKKSWSDEEDHEYVIDKFIDLKLREVFNDKGIMHMLLIMMVWISMLFIILFFINVDGSIVETNGKTYAIVYTNNDFYYLEEVEIEGEKINVYLAKQKLISKDGLEYQVYSFENDNVHKISVKDGDNETEKDLLSITGNGVQ